MQYSIDLGYSEFYRLFINHGSRKTYQNINVYCFLELSQTCWFGLRRPNCLSNKQNYLHSVGNKNLIICSIIYEIVQI